MLPLALLLTAVFPIAVTVAACYDLLTMQIPNRFPAAIALAFLALALLAGLPLTTLGIDLLLGLGVLLTTFILFAFGFIGGGDAKLFAAIVPWLGLEQTLPFLMWTALFGGALWCWWNRGRFWRWHRCRDRSRCWIRNSWFCCRSLCRHFGNCILFLGACSCI